MKRLGICEDRGSGIDKVIFSCEQKMLPPPEFKGYPYHTTAILFAPRNFRQMTKEEKVRACYQHACLKYESREAMTNQSLRDRFGIDNKNYPMISRILADSIEAGIIKLEDPGSKSRKYARYLPYWVSN